MIVISLYGWLHYLKFAITRDKSLSFVQYRTPKYDWVLVTTKTNNVCTRIKASWIFPNKTVGNI